MFVPGIYSWTGYVLIGNFIDATVAFVSQHMLPADLEADLNRLRAALPQITAVMDVAEVLKIMHPTSGVAEWLEQFRLAFEAAEDVLDELKYQELDNLVQNQHVAKRNASFLKRKLDNFLRRYVLDRRTLEKLKRAVKMLDAAAAGIGPLLQLATMIGVPAGFSEPQHETGKIFYCETSSVMTESRVYGRDMESSEIINWLVEQEVPDKLSAFSIVGMGGLGKTTIAQKICHDMRIETYFDEIIWVYVSNKFSVKDITEKFLEALGKNSSGSKSLDALQRSLKGILAHKKVLVVLDDVWNDCKISDWEKLLAPLRCTHQRSKFLVTTRMESVGDMLASVHNLDHSSLILEGLGEDAFLSLFNSYAFHGFNPDSSRDLQIIGKQIVEMLRGNPLAAKVIGRLLNSCMEHHHWGKVLKNIKLNGLIEAKELMDALKLSYLNLPQNLQTCFRYCSLFSKDHSFDKDELIKMWVGSGLIQQPRKKEMPEEIGKEYFNALVQKSIFLKCKDSKGYSMHDFIHDLARNVSEGECCRVKHNDNLDTVTSTVRHVSVEESEIERIFHLKNLRTLIISDPSSTFVLPADLIKRPIRLLSLVGFSCVVRPEEIGRLVHLRYLCIDLCVVGTELALLRSILTLYQLQVLKLSYSDGMNYSNYANWYNSNSETTEISNMTSLRYLELPEYLMVNIRGVHKLTALQELSFWVGSQRGCQLDELKALKDLRHLSIFNMENIRNQAEAENINLSEKTDLISLSLCCGEYMYWGNEPIMDCLKPHSNLKELTIMWYHNELPPIWMRSLPPPDLSSLTISDCALWKDLSFVRQMRHLKVLHLSTMDLMNEVDYSFDSTITDCPFPSLIELHCSKMPLWKSWGGPLDSYGLPNLKELVLCDCPLLVELPAMPISLFKFKLSNVGLNSLPDMYHTSRITYPKPPFLKSALREVEVQACQNLTSLNGFLQQDDIDFGGLEKLIIKNCENLAQLPSSAFGKFVSLKHLAIKGCPKLVSDDNQKGPLSAKLRKLSMGNCGQLDVLLLKLASELPTLAKLYIENSANITWIPSSENAYPFLQSLHIRGCDKLNELSMVERASGVNLWNNLGFLKISELHVDQLSLLYIKPIRTLRFVKELRIKKCSGLDALPEQWLLQNSSTLETLFIKDASSLRSLPGTMVRLTALRYLDICGATLLEEIPELPTTLVDKYIEGAGGRQLV